MNRRYLLGMIVLLLLISASTIHAQDNADAQELFGVVEGGEKRYTYFDIYDAVAGETLYVYAESVEIDTHLAICDIECVELFAENDDISQDDVNSAIEFTYPQNGDYSIAVSDCCDEAASGEFRLLLSYDASAILDILTGDAIPAGGQIAIPYIPGSPPPVAAPVPITGEPEVQEFYASISSEVGYSYFDLFGMQAGETVYLYAESDQIDTNLVVCDLDCEEVFVYNDDIDADSGAVDSALYFTFPEDGDYSIAVSDCCDEAAEGAFHLMLGFNAPQVLSGDALSTDARIAIPYELTYFPVPLEDAGAVVQIQQFVGEIGAESRVAYYDIYDAVAGETLYIYAQSNEIDSYLAVCDIECVELYAENDDISNRDFDSAIEFTFPQDGDYSIAVSDCCDEERSGSFLLLLGYNAPEVLQGEGTPNGSEIAQEYEPIRVSVPSVERTESISCENLVPGQRPELSGPLQTVGTDDFLIHYTTEGEDAATEAFVDEVLTVVERVLEVQIQHLGWPAPPRDCGEGGDTRFDFYLADILDEGIMGYAQPEHVIGDNPNSTLNETWAGYGFMVIDNDFQGMAAPLSVMRATVAHEFHHTVQFGYDQGDPSSWYYEATASWLETRTLPQEQDATGYTASVFLQPDLCIGTLNEESGLRIYGEWLLIDSLAQDFGEAAIPRLWEYIADFDGMDSYYMFLNELGITPQEVLQRYAVRNLLRSYVLSEFFPETVNVKAVVNGMGTITPDDVGVQEMSVDYVLIRHRGNYTFSINRDNLSLVVVGIDRGADQARIFELGQRGTVDTSAFSNAYVIVLNNDQHNDIDACSATDWELTVSDGTGSSQTLANGEIFDASKFVPAG